MGQIGLTVANMTLEPIAAINVAIPENYRMLNIALVDVGAGTSDISITRDGSIVAYGMIPYAGDELTEVIVQHYLVDFKTAESIKLSSTIDDEVTYKDIMSIEHTIPSSDVWEVVAPVVEKITTEVASKIKELNGGETVSACFVVGGGGKVHGFTEGLAKRLDIPEERVALRGEEVLGEVIFQQEEMAKDPLLVTPIGICLNYYEQKNNFIMVRFNGERLKLYDNNRLTIVDAALQAGFPNDQLFPKRGTPINFTVNGSSRIARGEAGEAAIVKMNGRPANINTPLEPNSEITIEPSTSGAPAVYTVGQLEEYNTSKLTFQINGRTVTCPKFVQVNGSLEPEDYEIQEGDVIETRNFYTVSQIAEFMDVVIDDDQEILVNNREATMDTLVYENFSIEWSIDEYGLARDQRSDYGGETVGSENKAYETQNVDDDFVADVTTLEESENTEGAPATDESGNQENISANGNTAETEAEGRVIFAKTPALEAEERARQEKDSGTSATEEELQSMAEEAPQQEAEPEQPEEEAAPAGTSIFVHVNGEVVELMGKDEYIFVDIFDRITFDLQAGKGRAIATLLNGRDAQFSELLHDGDKIELYWKEN